MYLPWCTARCGPSASLGCLALISTVSLGCLALVLYCISNCLALVLYCISNCLAPVLYCISNCLALDALSCLALDASPVFPSLNLSEVIVSNGCD